MLENLLFWTSRLHQKNRKLQQLFPLLRRLTPRDSVSFLNQNNCPRNSFAFVVAQNLENNGQRSYQSEHKVFEIAWWLLCEVGAGLPTLRGRMCRICLSALAFRFRRLQRRHPRHRHLQQLARKRRSPRRARKKQAAEERRQGQTRQIRKGDG